MRPRVKPAQALPPIWPYVGCDGCVGAGAAGLFVALVSTGFGLPVSEDVLLVSLGSRLGAMRPATLAAHCGRRGRGLRPRGRRDGVARLCVARERGVAARTSARLPRAGAARNRQATRQGNAARRRAIISRPGGAIARRRRRPEAARFWRSTAAAAPRLDENVRDAAAATTAIRGRPSRARARRSRPSCRCAMKTETRPGGAWRSAPRVVGQRWPSRSLAGLRGRRPAEMPLAPPRPALR